MFDKTLYESELHQALGGRMFLYGDDIWKVYPSVEECRETVEFFKKHWADGVSFLYLSEHPLDSSMLFGKAVKRDADTEEEINACADMLHDALRNDIRRHWFRNVKREYIAALCNLMYQSIVDDPSDLDDDPMSYYEFGASYTIMNGVTIDAPTPTILMETWNEAHPDEAPIRFSFRPYKKDEGNSET